jgi:hypothetical protein
MAAAVVLAFALMGSPPPVPHTSYGPGLSSCGAWVEARKSHDLSTVNFMNSWAAGFISATGRLSAGMQSTDNDAVLTYLDTFCGAHPLVSFENAVVHLTTELGGQ